MSLMTVVNLGLSFPGKVLFKGVGFQVEPGDRIGLVGPNGSGKTSLLRLLAKEISPEQGDIRIAGNSKIGYLPQDISERLSGPLLRSIMDSVPGRKSLRMEIGEIESVLEKNPKDLLQEKYAARLAEIHQEMNSLDTMYPSHKAEKILAGLGFHLDDFEFPVSNFSGGWRMRAALGSILFMNPELLLLDEPTNYLDIPSVRWLEQFLGEYQGAIILVCHDRDFLNRQIQRVISFEKEGVKIFRGNYDQYMKFREEEIKTEEARARNQELKVKEAKKFIERFKAKATKARQAQSKLKLLKKIEMVKTRQKEKSIRFSFPEVPRSGKTVITIQGMAKGYDDKVLYQDIDLSVFIGERVAVIGPNGFGKTTLLRMVSGEISPDQGSISLGHNVSMSYYAQHHSEMLDPNKTIIDEVYQTVPYETVSFVRSVCGAFLFTGDDVDKPVRVLSGGEKARVCIAKMLIKPGNLLVMDEPTNHLDLISSEILIKALVDFKGTLLFVSHNQSFINRLATKIWDIRDGDIVEYPGDLNEYYHHLALQEKEFFPLSSLKENEKHDHTGNVSNKNRISKKSIRKEKAERRHLISSRLKPIEKRLAFLEGKISDLEKREKIIEQSLADPDIFKDKGRSVPLLNEYGVLKKRLEEMISQWEESQATLEELKQEMEKMDYSLSN